MRENYSPRVIIIAEIIVSDCAMFVKNKRKMKIGISTLTIYTRTLYDKYDAKRRNLL